MSVVPVKFQARNSIEQVEEGDDLAPKFDDRGLITVVTTDASSGELLMQGYMNAEALQRTIQTGEATPGRRRSGLRLVTRRCHRRRKLPRRLSKLLLPQSPDWR